MLVGLVAVVAGIRVPRVLAVPHRTAQAGEREKVAALVRFLRREARHLDSLYAAFLTYVSGARVSLPLVVKRMERSIVLTTTVEVINDVTNLRVKNM